MGYKITDLTANSTPAVGDLIPNVDISDTTMAATGTTKKSTLQNIADFLASLTQTLTNKTLTSPTVNTPTVTGGTFASSALTTPKITTSINDANGNEVIKTPAATSAVNEVTLSNSATGNNVVLSATGDDTNITLDLKGKGTGVVRKQTSLTLQVFDSASNTLTGDGKAYFIIPAELNGMNLTGVFAAVVTAGTTGTTDIQLRNVTDSVDMLSTKLTIDSAETTSGTAATPAVIDGTKDDVATNDVIAIDVDAVSTTPAKGLIVLLTFGF